VRAQREPATENPSGARDLSLPIVKNPPNPRLSAFICGKILLFNFQSLAVSAILAIASFLRNSDYCTTIPMFLVISSVALRNSSGLEANDVLPPE